MSSIISKILGVAASILVVTAIAISLSSGEDVGFNGQFNSTSEFVNSSTGSVGIGYRNQSDLNLQLFYRFDTQGKNLVLGEAGRFTVSDGNWKNITFQNSYSDPIVIGTTNTHNGEPAIVFEARNVSSTWAEMRLCESEGGSNSGCDSHVAEEAGYLVVDSSKVDQVPGIDAGTFTDDGGIDTVKSISYSESFSSNPYVFTSVQTDNGLSPVESRVTTRSISGFDGAICQTASADACNTSHVPEDVGYLAVNPSNIPFAGMELGGQTGISDSNWASDTFTETFTQTPVALAENPTENGGQELQIDEVRSVTQTGLDFRYCEIEPTDTCDTHTGETVHWLAVEPGDLQYSTVVDSSSQGRDSDNGQFDINGDGVMSSNSYSFNGLDQRILLEPFTFFEEAFTTRSYSAWIKPDEVNDPQVIFEEGGSTNGLNIYINNSKIYYGAWSEDDSYQGDWISTSIQADKYQHVAFSFSDSNMSAYLDGNYIGSVNPGSSIATHGGTSAIGAMQGDTKTDTGDQSGDGYYFNGSIDEFRVFGEAITPQDVQEEYFYGKDGVFEGDYSSGTRFDTVDPQNWEKIEVDTTMTANTELSAKFERINSSGSVRAIDTFELSDGFNSFNIEGLPYTTGYRLNFSGNTTDPTETWKLNSYNVIGKDEPDGPKVSLNQPLNDSTPVNNVTFDFTPKCYSDLGCDTAELFFNYTQNFTENVVTDTTDDFQQGSFTNTSSRQGSVKLQGLKVASGKFQSTTGDVTVNDVGFEPDVIEFTVTNTNPTFDTTTTRGGEPYGFGHGFADCTGTSCNQVSFTQASGSASTNGAFAASSDQYSILMGDTGNDGTGGSIGIQGNVSSTSTDGFTVTFDTDTIGNQVTYRAYKTRGDVDVGSFNTPTSNGQQSISTGFQGDYLNVITQPQLTSMNTQNNFAGSDTGWSHGYATDTGSSEQVAMGVSQYQENIDDHVFTSSSGQVIDLLEAKSKGGITGRVDASLSSFDSNGFTLDYSNTASGQPAIYLVMDTGGSAEAGYETTPSSTGDQEINTDLNPDHVNFVASNTVSGIDVEGYSGANGAENHWGWMFGSGNTTDQRSMGFSSHSNSVNGHASGSSASDIFQLLYSDQDGNILGQDKATLSSTSPGSFTMNWNSITTSTTTDVKYDQILYSYVAFSEGLETDGKYESEAFKAQKPVYWNTSQVTSSTPSGTSLDLEYGENSSGSYQFYNSISNVPRSSYLKYRANLSTTDPENTPSLEKVNITYLRPESWNVRDSINSVSNNTQQQFEYNFSTIFDLPQEIKWNVRVNQSDGKSNYADKNFTAIIADNPPNSPLWRNLSQEKDTVPKTGTNELRAQGFDSVRLSHAILATNETGSFENKTGVYGSPIELKTDAKWTWSNFTWVNSSISGQEIEWKIWYNDTNGQYNSTDSKSFFVDDTDTAPPVITIDSPANTSLDISDIPLEVSASETVDQWKYNLDNSGNQSFTPDTTLNSVSEGTHSIKVWANDTSGNYGSKQRDFTVDLTKPTISNIQDNATSDFFQIDTANISLEASDSLSGLNEIKLATDETGSFENKTIYGSPKTLSNISGETITESFQWRNESFSGTLNYKFWVRDAAGNWRKSSTDSFNVQPLEPYLFANLTARDWDKGNNDDMVVREQGLGIGLEETAKNLQEYYLFEEFSASALKDRSSGIETRSSGGITTDQSGILNSQTYSFDGTDDYIAVNRSYDTSEDIKEVSVCSWAKSSTNKGQIIMSYDRSEFWRFSLSSDQGANGFVGWHTESADMNGNTKVTDGNWHHICAVFDSSVTNEKKIYVDGQLDAEADQFSTGTGFGTADGSETETYGFIGTGSEASSFDGARGPGQYLEGKIDSLQVFNRSLSQSEIQELAVSNPPRKGSQIRDFDVPGYQEPVILESTSSGLGADTEFRLSGSNQNGEELFFDSSSGSKNFSLSVGQDNKFSLNVNGSTSNKLKSPIMNSLTIWMDSKMYSSTVSAVNEAGNVKDNAEVSFFNRFDDILSEDQLSSSQTDTEDRIPRMENYSVKVDAPTGYSFQEVRVNQIESDTNKNLDFQMISNYSGTSIPESPSASFDADPVIAFDDASVNYQNAELVLPYTNGSVDKIAHCTNWDFTNRECSSSTDWDLKDPSFYNTDLNGTHAVFNVTSFDAYATVKETTKAPNLKVNQVSLNSTDPVEGETIKITGNVSNNESVSANTKVNLTVSSYNGSKWLIKQKQSKTVDVSGNSFNLTNYTFTSKPGRYRFNITADPQNSITETSEIDNSNSTELNASSHHIFYGNTSSKVNLSDSSGSRFQSWISSAANGTLFFADSDYSFNPSNLKALNGSSDLTEADQALNLTGHNDSLSNLFDSNDDGSADLTGCVPISGSDVCDVPLINSTNSSNFVTGTVYDSTAGSPYDGSQPLVFVTEINSSKQGKYGNYDYEIKVPYSLGSQDDLTQEVAIYQEIS